MKVEVEIQPGVSVEVSVQNFASVLWDAMSSKNQDLVKKLIEETMLSLEGRTMPILIREPGYFEFVQSDLQEAIDFQKLVSELKCSEDISPDFVLVAIEYFKRMIYRHRWSLNSLLGLSSLKEFWRYFEWDSDAVLPEAAASKLERIKNMLKEDQEWIRFLLDQASLIVHKQADLQRASLCFTMASDKKCDKIGKLWRNEYNNLTLRDGRNILMVSIESGSIFWTKFLLKRGGLQWLYQNPKRKSHSALHCAVSMLDMEIAELILMNVPLYLRSALLELKTCVPFEMTALHMACTRESVAFVQLLLKYECCYNAFDFNRKTPYHYCRENDELRRIFERLWYNFEEARRSDTDVFEHKDRLRDGRKERVIVWSARDRGTGRSATDELFVNTI